MQSLEIKISKLNFTHVALLLFELKLVLVVLAAYDVSCFNELSHSVGYLSDFVHLSLVVLEEF
jgi:hypothetical protein